MQSVRLMKRKNLERFCRVYRKGCDIVDFMKIVRKICNVESTDCRSLNKSALARKLMDMASIPNNADIIEIPLDWKNQVAILFIIPDDDNYYCLYAGHWNNNIESMQLVISGTVYRRENRFDFDFYNEEKEVGLDYFKAVGE